MLHDMPLYQHRFSGVTAAGDVFMYTWWANSIRDIANAQVAAVNWNALLWNGPGGVNGFKTHVVAGVAMVNVTTVQVTQATGLQTARVDTAQAIAGTAAGNPMPADVAMVISLRTVLANRQGRGRFYLPQPAASEITATGRVAALMITHTGAALAAAWAGYNTANDRPVVYSRTSRNIQNISSFNIGDLYDTQRRRENKVTEARTVTAMP